MKKPNFLKRKIFLSCISGLLAFSFILAPLSVTLTVNRADAAWATVPGQILQLAEEAGTFVSTTATAVGMGSFVTKEYLLDTIAWGLVNLILQQMIRSVTQWVNSGFKGSPAFVQDLGGFLTNIADQYAGNFIYGTPLGLLCSPFKLNIKLALDIQYRQTRGTYQSQCRLSSIVKNVDKFIGGDFLAGGWNGWYDVALNPKTNPYNSMLDAQAAMTLGISNAQGKKLEILKMGNGFLSKEVCTGVGGREKCSIVTPGNTINNALNNALNIPNGRLVVADELNELIGALFAQLAGKVLGGVGGLLGLTGGGGSNGTNYFDQMAAENASTTYNGVETQNPIPDAIKRQQEYLASQVDIIKLINDAKLYKEAMYGDSCGASDELTTSLKNQLALAISSVVSVPALILKLQAYSADYTLLVSSTTSTSTISALLTKYKVTSKPAAQATIMTAYSNISSTLHTEVENLRIKMKTIPELKEEIKTFTDAIDLKCKPPDGGGP